MSWGGLVVAAALTSALAFPATSAEQQDQDPITLGLRELVPEIPATIEAGKKAVEDLKEGAARQVERMRQVLTPGSKAEDEPADAGTPVFRTGVPRTFGLPELTLDPGPIPQPRRDATVRLRVDRNDIGARDQKLVEREKQLAAEEARCAEEPGTRGCGWDLDQAKDDLVRDKERLRQQKESWNAELGRNAISPPFHRIEELASEGGKATAAGHMTGGEPKSFRERCDDEKRHYWDKQRAGDHESARLAQYLYHDLCRSPEEKQQTQAAERARARVASRRAEIAAKRQAPSLTPSGPSLGDRSAGDADSGAGDALLGAVVGTALQALTGMAAQQQAPKRGSASSTSTSAPSQAVGPSQPRCRSRELACGTPGGCSSSLPLCPY